MLLLLLLLGGAAGAARAATPMEAIKSTNARINRLLKKKTKPGSAQDERVKKQVKQAVNSFLDFRELAKRSLGRHWKARTNEEREEFVKLLQELIERNYVKQLRSNLGYKVEYRGQEVTGDTAKVTTAVNVKKNGRTTEIVIEYKMQKTPGGWMVYDVVTDDVSIVRNYRSQFNRIIRRESYEALVDKIRSKLEEGQDKA
jgi:phospholipid transport system substrate-binding protein